MQTQDVSGPVAYVVEPTSHLSLSPFTTTGAPPFSSGDPGGAPRVYLNTTLIRNLTTFGTVVFDAAQLVLKGRAHHATRLLISIARRKWQRADPPDAVYITLALLSLRAVAKQGEALCVPADWEAALQRIEEQSEECAAQQVTAAMAFIESRYPGVLVREERTRHRE